MPFGLDSAALFGGRDDASSTVSEDASLPLEVQRMSSALERVRDRGDGDSAATLLARTTGWFADPPCETPLKKVLQLTSEAAQTVAEIATERAYTSKANPLNRSGSIQFMPLHTARQELLRQRTVPGALQASCDIAGIEASARARLGEVKSAAHVLGDQLRDVRLSTLNMRPVDVAAIHDAYNTAVHECVEVLTERKGPDQLRDLLSTIIDSPVLNGELTDADHRELLSVVGSAVGRCIVELLEPERTFLVDDSIGLESDFLRATSSVFGASAGDARKQALIDDLRVSVAQAVRLAIEQELLIEEQPDLDPEVGDDFGGARYLSLLSFVYQSRIIAKVDRNDQLFETILEQLVKHFDEQVTKHEQALDDILNEGLQLPDGTARMFGDVVQVDSMRDDRPLGEFVRDGLWQVLDDAELTGRLTPPSGPARWIYLWHDLARTDDIDNLWMTLSVDSLDKEAALRQATLRARLAITATAMNAEISLALDQRELLLLLWDHTLQFPAEAISTELMARREEQTKVAAVKLSETILRGVTRLDVAESVKNRLIDPKLLLPFGNQSSDKADIAELSFGALDAAIALRLQRGQLVPEKLTEALGALMSVVHNEGSILSIEYLGPHDDDVADDVAGDVDDDDNY
jgi:hypothetical protein